MSHVRPIERYVLKLTICMQCVYVESDHFPIRKYVPK